LSHYQDMTAILGTASWRSETLTRALVARKDCDILADLIFLRDEGEKSERVNEYYENQRRYKWPLDTRPLNPMSYINTYSSALQNMNQAAQHFLQTKRFLDLGCSPGGYSTYILRTNPQATGIGISLPLEFGAPDLYIPSELLPRIDVHINDLMNYDLAPSIPSPASPVQPILPLPFKLASFDLIICDSRWVRHPDNERRPWNWTRLIISQLLISLRAVSSGGTIFLRLSCVERTLTGRILLAMCRIANIVRCVKSDTFQATRSYFYVLAQRVDRGTGEFRNLVIALERLWYLMTFEGEEGYGRDITPEDEDSITSEEDLTSEEGLLKIVQLGTPVWNIQHSALSYFLHKKGVI